MKFQEIIKKLKVNPALPHTLTDKIILTGMRIEQLVVLDGRFILRRIYFTLRFYIMSIVPKKAVELYVLEPLHMAYHKRVVNIPAKRTIASLA